MGEPADENAVIKMSGDDDYSYRGVTRTARKTMDFLSERILVLEGQIAIIKQDAGMCSVIVRGGKCPAFSAFK